MPQRSEARMACRRPQPNGQEPDGMPNLRAHEALSHDVARGAIREARSRMAPDEEPLAHSGSGPAWIAAIGVVDVSRSQRSRLALDGVPKGEGTKLSILQR